MERSTLTLDRDTCLVPVEAVDEVAVLPRERDVPEGGVVGLVLNGSFRDGVGRFCPLAFKDVHVGHGIVVGGDARVQPNRSPTAGLAEREPAAAAVPPPRAVMLGALVSAQSDWPPLAGLRAWSSSAWKDANFSVIDSSISLCTSAAARGLSLTVGTGPSLVGSWSRKGSTGSF